MNMTEYVIASSNISFKKQPFCEVDALVLAQLSYLHFEEVESDTKIEELKFIPNMDETLLKGRSFQKEDAGLLDAIMSSDRFGSIKILDSVNNFNKADEVQFAATTFSYRKGDIYVAFRGTDGTIVGWKEDLNMTYMDNIPSQIIAAEYLTKIANEYPHTKITIMGHSKGGNNAVYSVSSVDPLIQDRVLVVYNFDGPGFQSAFYDKEGYKRIENKIIKFVPQTSIIGRLLVSDTFHVIKSNKTFIMQHLAYSWEIEDNKFIRMDGIDDTSNSIYETINNFLNELEMSERKEVVDSLYAIFEASECYYLDDIMKNKDKILACVEAYAKTDRKKRNLMFNFVSGILLDVASNALKGLFKK